MADPFRGFLFDVEKWFGSVATQRMSFVEKGVYAVMLFQQWREQTKTLPDDPELVADLIAVTPEQRVEVLAAWPVVRRKFVADRRTPVGRMFNAALERTRRQQRASWLKKVNAGREGGKASARRRLDDNDLPTKHRLSSAQRSSTDLNRSDLIRSDVKRKEVLRASFDRFAAVYPKTASDAAWQEWQRIDPSDGTATQIIDAAEQFARHVADWESRFVKQAQNWLKERGWLEVYRPKKAALANIPEVWTCPHLEPCGNRAQCANATALNRPRKAS